MFLPPGIGTFFLRTGTCAYGERCKFQHPQDRPPPTLNSRGDPSRHDEVDCAHYIKKGWCAFGLTCKFNHPDLGGPQGSPYSLAPAPPSASFLPTPQQATSYAGQSTGLYPAAVPVPAMYYMPSQLPAGFAGGMAYPTMQSLGISQGSGMNMGGGGGGLQQGSGGGGGLPSSSGMYRQQQQQAASYGAAMLSLPGMMPEHQAMLMQQQQFQQAAPQQRGDALSHGMLAHAMQGLRIRDQHK